MSRFVNQVVLVRLSLWALTVSACAGSKAPSDVSSRSFTQPPPVVALVPAPSVSAPAPSAGDVTAPSAGDVIAPSKPKLPETTLREAPVPEGMARVTGGQFVMGRDLGGEEDEHPAHRVTVQSFDLDLLEVTVANYVQCVQAGVCRMYREDAAKSFKAGDDARFRGPQQPISGVSWDDANAYCQNLGKRLPTEAEWERAARGDDDRPYPWGNEAPDPKRQGCFGHAGGPYGQPTCDVGSFPEAKGPYGHLDLGGNVWEWLKDDYDPYAYRRSTAEQGVPGSCQAILRTQNDLRAAGRQGFTGKNPIPTTCEKVLRGGAFNYPGTGLRVTNRVHHPGAWRMLVAGFRCAKDIGA